MDWLKMTAAEQGREIGAGRIDPVALTEAHLDAIAAHPFGPRIYARTTPDRARAEAQAAAQRARQGLRRGPLDGVPISWKDLYDTAGVETCSGSDLLAGRVPLADAEVLKNATLQGLVCLGKTHQTELAFSGLGLNPVTESPPCVNDTESVAGGSSSGAATSVAFGLAAAAVGSDTGGSVRIPAAWNDLVGLKTTAGLLSLKGVVPLAARFDTVGPLCRSVEDAALMLAALGGGAAPDLEGASLAGKRLMLLETIVMDDLREAPRRGFGQAVERLQAAGALVERRELPWLEETFPIIGPLFAGEAWGTWKAAIEAAPDKMFPPIRERFQGGAAFSAADFVQAWQKLDQLRARWSAAVAGYDAVILPCSAIQPPNAARLLADPDFFTTENLLALRNTRLGNMMGVSALTLPTGVPSAGIMFFAPPFAESALLRLGQAAERALSAG
ncbi:amidase [Frigidibacter sp. ROC022]|uniref:amidase n=1 Tax=Frigidibacter sp. ROC022 TaxID=2971796 RepID=UPI003FCCED22